MTYDITKLTDEELDKCRLLCNFTQDEMQYFNLCLKKRSNVQIAFELNVSESTVSKLAKRVKSKIRRII